uniref:DUF5412 family protein n=1 Tax=Thaumasiovibrio occultus TaxID=1891184 RepID=UPI000B35A74A|nr:DUF5412 family protein [Thaumasiovibrio occultus]
MISPIRVVLVLLLGVAFLMLAQIGNAFWQLGDVCGNQVFAEYPSPDGSYKAVVFERDCGATADISTQVSLLPRNGAVGRDTGNVFVVEDEYNDLALSLTWRDDNHVVIEHPQHAKVFKANTRVNWLNAITIDYLAAAPVSKSPEKSSGSQAEVDKKANS